MKNVFDTVDHIIELSEINAALKISFAEEIKDAALDQYNNAEATLKNMNRGAGRLFGSVYTLLSILTLFVYQVQVVTTFLCCLVYTCFFVFSNELPKNITVIVYYSRLLL